MGSNFRDFYNELPEDTKQRVEAAVKEEAEMIDEYHKWCEENNKEIGNEDNILEYIKTLPEDKAKAVKHRFDL